METTEMKSLWSGGRLGGRDSAEDSQVVAVMGNPEALLTETPEALTMVMGIPEAVDMEIPKVPTT